MARMLTGDLNLAHVEWVVQYRIQEPADYLFHIGGERGAIHEMTIIELLPRVAINQLTYQRLDAGGQPVENVRANYVMLKGDDSQWRIAMVAGESSPVGESGS